MPGVTPALTPFVTGPEAGQGPVLPTVAEGKRPPLDLQVELVYPDGTTIRWDKDAREAKDRATGITFRTQRYTGFADAQLTLNRRIDLEYPDLGLLDGLNLIGHDGSVAYEGRIASMPRNLQSTPQITVQAQGWMSHAKDQPFVEVYVDRDLSKWTSMSRQRRVELAIANYQITDGSQLNDESGTPAVSVGFQDGWVSPFKPRSEMLWPPQPGITLTRLYYKLATDLNINFADAAWFLLAGVVPNDHSQENTTQLKAEGASGYNESAGIAGLLSMYYTATPVAAANTTFYAHFSQLAVYGNHGLTRRGEDPGGFYVSDMIANIASRFAPKLDTSGIEETTFVVPHASFTSETLPYDAFQTLNAYHRWEMAVYEKRKLSYWPINLSDYDWEIRTTDAGTTFSLQGDDTDNLYNGVVVNYRDLATGYQTRLSPDLYPELRDESPDNPANLAGVKRYTPMTLSVPTTKEGAIQMGRTFLAEFAQAKAIGSITIAGHIRDRAGHWQQGWKVRAGDRLQIADLPNDSVRVVAETEWNHDSKTLTIAVDSSFKRLDAILARLGVAVEASNLQLP